MAAHSAGELSLPWVVAGAACAAIIAVISVRARFLTVGGGCAQFLLGWLLITVGGPRWVAPILVFFLSSSFLSRWSAARRPAVHALFAKGGVRDYWQVLANGGLSGPIVLAAFIDPGPVWYAAYAGVCAAAAADTWGTEIGVLSKYDPVSLPLVRRVPPGTSGAVSAVGSVGAALGAVLIAVTAALSVPSAGAAVFMSALLGGLAGAAVDSLMGGVLQARYRCRACGSAVERADHCGSPSVLQGGYRWITNDIVNLACTSTGAVTAGVVVRLLFPP